MPLIRLESPFPGCTLGVWHITESNEELDPSSFLTADDLLLLGTYRNELRKRQWVACRRLLASIRGIPERIHYDADGKPYLENSTEHISLSHAGEYAVALVSGQFRVGVDIELPRERILRVAERFLNPRELSRITGPHRLEQLYVHWCAKEAAFKLQGRQGVDLQRDLIVEPFDYLCTGNGSGRITLNLSKDARVIPFRYQVTQAYILVSAAERM